MSKELFRKAILSIMEDKIPLNSTWCTVKAVDAAKKTCNVILDDDENLLLEEILLGYDKSGCVILPKLNTDVLVQFIDNTKTIGYVICVQETDNVEILGSNFGEIAVTSQLRAKINALETQINNLKTIITTWIPTPNDGGLGFKTAATSWASSQITLTTLNDIKGKVKHGNGE
mgnify:CR=1 FL=1